jgi:hypothetical protein
MTTRFIAQPGRFYQLDRQQLTELPPSDDPVDYWVCRRVADYPEDAVFPPVAELTFCTRCDATIVYTRTHTITAPKVCLQCVGLEPAPLPQALPWPEDDRDAFTKTVLASAPPATPDRLHAALADRIDRHLDRQERDEP